MVTVVAIVTTVVGVGSKFKSASFVPFAQESRLPSVMTPDLTSWNSSVILSSSQSIGFGCSELRDKTVLSRRWLGQGWSTGETISEQTPKAWKNTAHYANVILWYGINFLRL